MESLPPELIHAIALTGHLTPPDVRSLSLTSTHFAAILTHDPYAHNIHRALLGVLSNACAGHWTAARYAMARKWFWKVGEDGGEEEWLWKEVANLVAGETISLDTTEEIQAWEDILLSTLSLDREGRCLEGWSPVAQSYKRTSLLHLGAARGCERLVEWVVGMGGDLELRNMADETPLHLACCRGHLGVVRMLVEEGAELDSETIFSDTPLLHACENGHADVVAYLASLDRVGINSGNRYAGVTPLAAACERGHVSVIRVLLQAGVKIDCPVYLDGNTKWSPLFVACSANDVGLVSLLIESGFGDQVPKTARVWIDAFAVAHSHGFTDIVHTLIAHGVHPVTPPVMPVMPAFYNHQSSSSSPSPSPPPSPPPSPSSFHPPSSSS